MVSQNEHDEIIRGLSDAISSISYVLPLIEKYENKIPTDVLNLIDDINQASVSV